MTGKSPLRVTTEQREGLERLARSADREEAVAGELLASPVENRTNWTLPRLSAEIERRDLPSHQSRETVRYAQSST